MGPGAPVQRDLVVDGDDTQDMEVLPLLRIISALRRRYASPPGSGLHPSLHGAW